MSKNDISTNQEDKLFNKNYFDENDEKSRIFDDIEDDLLIKLKVSYHIYLLY